VHATPQPLPHILLAKLVIVLFLIVQAFVVLNVGIFLVGAIPAIVFPEVSMPIEAFPAAAFARRSVEFFVDILPIVVLQFLLGVLNRSVMPPLGVGVGLWVVSVTVLTWRYNYVLLYNYAAIDFMSETGSRVARSTPIGIGSLSLTVASVIAVIGVVLYTRRSAHG
jgi:lantibiotic transport system permease protein